MKKYYNVNMLLCNKKAFTSFLNFTQNHEQCSYYHSNRRLERHCLLFSFNPYIKGVDGCIVRVETGASDGCRRIVTCLV